jgi:hypothetical protein
MIDMDEKAFQEIVDGIIDGLAAKHFGIGDGLDHDAGCGDEGDGHYELRVFYYDDETELRHVIKLDVTAVVERIEEN